MGKTYAALLGPLVLGPAGAAGDAAAAHRAVADAAARARAGHRVSRCARAAAALQPHWSVDVRTGDTAASARARQDRRLPTALVTTPESLTLLLSRADWRERFAQVACVVVDEWHELMASKRGVQVELALARLRGRGAASADLGAVGDARQSRRGARLPRRSRCTPPRRASSKALPRSRWSSPPHGRRRSSAFRGAATSASRCCRRSYARSSARARR